MGIGLRMVTFANQAGESILLHSDIIRMIFRRQKIMWFKRCADLLIQALYDRLNFLPEPPLHTARCAAIAEARRPEKSRPSPQSGLCRGWRYASALYSFQRPRA